MLLLYDCYVSFLAGLGRHVGTSELQFSVNNPKTEQLLFVSCPRFAEAKLRFVPVHAAAYSLEVPFVTA